MAEGDWTDLFFFFQPTPYALPYHKVIGGSFITIFFCIAAFFFFILYLPLKFIRILVIHCSVQGSGRASGGKNVSIAFRIAVITLGIFQAAAGVAVAAFIGLMIIFMTGFNIIPLWVGIPLLFVVWVLILIHSLRKRTIEDIIQKHKDLQSYGKPSAKRQPQVVKGGGGGSTGSDLDHTEMVDMQEEEGSKEDTKEQTVKEEKPSQLQQYSASSQFKQLLVEEFLIGCRDYPLRIVQGFKRRWCLLISGAILFAVLSILFNLLTCNVCVTYSPIEVSTSYTRRLLYKDEFCKSQSICFAYLTVPEDLSTSVIVNYQPYSSAFASSSVYVSTSPLDDSTLASAQKFNATCFRLWMIEDEERYQCWADITGLTPSTTYYLKPYIFFPDSSNATYSALKFRSAPALNSDEAVVFAAGGDTQFSTAGVQLMKHAASFEPHFAIVAGDISYENGIGHCYRRWDFYLGQWEKHMTTPSGYSIPILTAVGNHEAGEFKRPRSDDPFYIRYFPHELNLQAMDPQARSLQHSHRFGSHLFVMILDTHIHDPIASQTEYIDRVLGQDAAGRRNKIVSYHGAVYPSVEGAHNEIPGICKEMQQLWAPLFDKHAVKIAFENHYHNFKESYPIMNHQVHENGTLYLGDGAWGVDPSKFKQYDEKLIKTVLNISSFFMVNATASGIEVRGIGHNEEKGIHLLTELKH